jgi:hypothetical protein
MKFCNGTVKFCVAFLIFKRKMSHNSGNLEEAKA